VLTEVVQQKHLKLKDKTNYLHTGCIFTGLVVFSHSLTRYGPRSFGFLT